MGGNQALTLNSGSDGSHEGVLTLSENGQYLTFVGYNLAPGNTDALTATNGTIGVIGNSVSTLNTSTLISRGNPLAPSGNTNMRAATTIDGNEF